MNKIIEILEKYGLAIEKDESLDFSHVLYKRLLPDKDIIISHNYIVFLKDLFYQKLIDYDNLEDSFYEFETKYFSSYFFREDTDLKWNYYLILIVGREEYIDADISQLEQDDKYLRKLVMTEEEFEVYINHGANTKNSEKNISGIDTFAEWQCELSQIGLDGILFYSFESAKVRQYIENRKPIQPSGAHIKNWKNNDNFNEKKLIQKIVKLNLDNFRSHCLQNKLDIPLTTMNLISGSNGSGKSSICSAIEYALTGNIMGSDNLSGKTIITFINRNGKYESLNSEINNIQKKSLDKLWYGTVTNARKSSLNRNFHTFNYLGLEASGTYMQSMDITELIKNILFGIDVTEAEKNMFRFGAEFTDKKKEYEKSIKELTKEIENLSIEEENEVIPKEKIFEINKKLGYRGDINEDLIYSGKKFFLNFLTLINQTVSYVEFLSVRCNNKETIREVMKKCTELDRKRQIYKDMKEERIRTKDEMELCEQNCKDYIKVQSKLMDRKDNIQALIRVAEKEKLIYWKKQDFLKFKDEYLKNSEKKNQLELWFQNSMIILDIDEGIDEINKKINNLEKRIDIHKIELENIDKEIEVQKKHNNQLNILLHEFMNLMDNHIKIQNHMCICPLCGHDFETEEKFNFAIDLQKKNIGDGEEGYSFLLIRKTEEKGKLEKEKQLLASLIEKKQKVIRRDEMIFQIKDIMDIDDTKSFGQIRNDVELILNENQKWLKEHRSKFKYVEKVLKSEVFLLYDSDRNSWVNYLKCKLEDLTKDMKKTKLEMQKQNSIKQKLEHIYENLISEKPEYSEQQWVEYKQKVNAVQFLRQFWKLEDTLVIKQWIEQYNMFSGMVRAAEDIYKKQEALLLKQRQADRLEKEKKVLEERKNICQKVCAVIDRQVPLKDVMENFLKENSKQIELFFKLLHRPKEFGTLKITNGTINLVRNRTGEPVQSSHMSTGQRMALAFSVMMTLHLNAANAPGFLMLDEPVANLDDMHVLNLIDLLRELAINGTQIIITTADAQMAKFLRRKFSFFGKEYSHFELTRKGDEQTFIHLKHYKPDEKQQEIVKLE